MELHYLIKSLQKLRPNENFSITENDLNSLIWVNDTVTTPSKSEIEVAIKAVKVEEKAAAEAKAAQRKAILDRLGITSEEAALLLS